MDQPELDPTRHRQALSGLERINRLSSSSGILWPVIRKLGRQFEPRPVRILDVACGAGDVAISLFRKAHRAHTAVEIAGCDLSPIAIEYARQRADEAGAAVTFQVLDVLHDDLPSDYDVITCSLFLHHLDEADALRLLRRMGDAARQGVLVNDLARSRLGYVLAWAGTRVLSRSPIVHVDGPLSVEGAFTPAEALRLAEQAGLQGATVRRRWPFRYLLQWSRV